MLEKYVPYSRIKSSGRCVLLLLSASGVIFMIHPLTIFIMHFMKHPQMDTGHSAVIPGGPILVVIFGLGILGLGVVKGIRTGGTAAR
jgi:hypothetical protein